MKYLKVMLPMLAFVLAIGMSFAFSNRAPGDLVVEIDGQLYESPINCNGTAMDCTTWITKDGNLQEVQVKREISPGEYENVKTGTQDQSVFDFHDLTPLQ